VAWPAAGHRCTVIPASDRDTPAVTKRSGTQRARACQWGCSAPTSRGQDALGCLRRAVAGAERVPGPGGLRAGRGVRDVAGADGYVIGEAPAPIAVVTDNGPCFRGGTFADAFAGDDPLFRHVRTRGRSPQANGVAGRFFGTLKYGHLYRATIGDGNALAVEVSLFRHTCNTLRPHQAPGERTPRAAYPAAGHCDELVAFGGPAT
jgi:putative transposase